MRDEKVSFAPGQAERPSGRGGRLTRQTSPVLGKGTAPSSTLESRVRTSAKVSARPDTHALVGKRDGWDRPNS